MGKALPKKSSAEISHEVKWSMGKETAGGEQNGCGPTASRLVGGALSAIPVSSFRRTRLLRWRQPGHFAGATA